MSGLCGWIGGRVSNMPPKSVLDKMSDKLGFGLSKDNNHAPCRQTFRGDRGLCLRPGTAGGDFASIDNLYAAIDGEVLWHDVSLANIAQRTSNAAALIEAYRKYDRSLFDHLSGLFTFAIIDSEQNRAIIATDRMGNFPVYYAEIPGGAAFGTRSKAVLAHPCVSDVISPQGVFNYFYFFMSPAPLTIYRDQKKLLAAQYLLVENGRVGAHFYWNMPYCDTSFEKADTLHFETRETLNRAVARAVEGEDVGKVGSFLSGGLDSTTVSGLLGEVTGQPAKCFTVGFYEEGYDETGYAKIGAEHFNAKHHAEYMTPEDMFNSLPDMAATYDEPFGNSSAAAGYFCAMRAKANGVDVLLAGDGGDELFAGNDRYLKQKIFHPYNNAPSFLTRGLLKPAVFGFPFGHRISLISKARNYIRQAETPLPDRMQGWNWMERNLVSDAFEEDLLSVIDPAQPLELMRVSYNRADTDSEVQKMMQMDLQITLADNDLPKVNRTCELAGIRVKFPFLDDDVVEHSARIPPAMLIAGNELRHYYKQAFRDFLPAETLSKSKHGFGLPFDNWAHSYAPMRELIRDCLSSFKNRGYLKPYFIDRVFNSGEHGDSTGIGSALFDIVLFELWLQAN